MQDFADVYFVGPREAKAPKAMFSRSHCDDSHSTLSHSSPMFTSTVLVRPIVPSEDLVLLYPAPTLSYSRPCPVQAIAFSLLARCELLWTLFIFRAELLHYERFLFLC